MEENPGRTQALREQKIETIDDRLGDRHLSRLGMPKQTSQDLQQTNE